MEKLLQLKAEYPDARLVVGNTEVGIEMKFKDARYPVLIGVTHISELNRMEVSIHKQVTGFRHTLQINGDLAFCCVQRLACLSDSVPSGSA